MSRIDARRDMSIITGAEVKTGNGAEFLFSPISYQLNSLALKRPVLLWMTERSAHPVLASATKRVEPGALSFPAERGAMSREGYVYLIKAETGHYKIGRSSNVPNRMKLFAVKLPFKFEIIHTFWCADMVEAERQLHIIFDQKRVNGEWFNLNKFDVQDITNIDHFAEVEQFLKRDENDRLWGMPELWAKLPGDDVFPKEMPWYTEEEKWLIQY